MKYIMKVHDVKYYLAYATSALREAKNSNTIKSQVKSETGIEIEIIDGLKEAKIISNAKPIEKNNPFKKNLYVDVGGGSTELSFVQNGEKTISKSFNIGTVRDLNKNDISKRELPKNSTGVVVTKISENSPLKFISVNDVIVELQKKKITNSKEIYLKKLLKNFIKHPLLEVSPCSVLVLVCQSFLPCQLCMQQL